MAFGLDALCRMNKYFKLSHNAQSTFLLPTQTSESESGPDGVYALVHSFRPSLMHSHTLLFSHIVFVCPRSVEHTNEEWVLFFFKAFYFNEIVFKRGHTNKGKKHTIYMLAATRKKFAPLGRQQQSANENFIYQIYII